MRTLVPLAVLALTAATATAPLAAQQATPTEAERFRQRIEAILNLPRRAEEVRKEGVPDSTVRTVLDILVKDRVPATEATVVLESQRDAARENGPTDNFGAFVQSQLAAGKRGRELAAAIRAEHQARGKGKPTQAGPPEGRGPNARKRPANDTSTAAKRPGNPNAKRPH